MRSVRLQVVALAVLAVVHLPSGRSQDPFEVREYRVPAGSHPHDVAPARDGGVWYTAHGILDKSAAAVFFCLR